MANKFWNLLILEQVDIETKNEHQILSYHICIKQKYAALHSYKFNVKKNIWCLWLLNLLSDTILTMKYLCNFVMLFSFSLFFEALRKVCSRITHGILLVWFNCMGDVEFEMPESSFELMQLVYI